jgi:carboxyl-terminal processing protease
MKIKLLLCFLLLAPQWASAAPAEPSLEERMKLLRDIMEIVKRDHVKEKKDEELFKAAVNGMLNFLDPHSYWLDPEAYKNMQTSMRGKFGGLGIEVTMDKGFVRVVSPIDDTPAARAGVLAGDLITHLNGKPVLGKTLAQAVQVMRGRPNTTILLTIKRKANKKPMEISITRAMIKIKAVTTKNFGKVTYLRLSIFNELATPNLSLAITEAEKNHQPEAYILDLRNNPGGLLDEAVSVSDLFLQKGEIVSIRGRNKPNWAQLHERYRARPGDMINGKPIIVLINGGSASASEIVAGALQDHHRAITLGTLSFGKGSVQTVRPLGNNRGALRLTTARYYTPSGRAIQARGVTPDIVIEQKVDKKDKTKKVITGETDLQGYLENDDAGANKKRSGSSYYLPKEQKNDTQLNHALNLLNGVIRATKKAQESAGFIGG